MIEVGLSKLYKGLLFAFFLVILMHILFYLAYFIIGIENKTFLKVLELFDLNEEQNVPTLFSTIILLISFLLLVTISSREEKKTDRRLWLGLAAVFLYIGIDEFTTIHEGIADHLIPDAEFTGFLRFSWVIPFSIIILAIVIIYLPFVFRLPKRIRNKIILAGAIFVTSGFGLEMVGAKIYEIYGKQSIPYVTIFTIEETGEMFGILLFISALTAYLKMKAKAITIRL